MDAELFLDEEEDEVEESPLPTKSAGSCYRSLLQSKQGQNTQMGCQPLVVPSLPRVLGAYATYTGLLYSIPVCVNLDYRACVKGGVALCPSPNSVCLCIATFAWFLFKSGVVLVVPSLVPKGEVRPPKSLHLL